MAGTMYGTTSDVDIHNPHLQCPAKGAVDSFVIEAELVVGVRCTHSLDHCAALEVSVTMKVRV
jgi:hypothetical protein